MTTFTSKYFIYIFIIFIIEHHLDEDKSPKEFAEISKQIKRRLICKTLKD